MSLAVPKVMTSTQNTDLINGGWMESPCSGLTVPYVEVMKVLAFSQGQHAAWVFSECTCAEQESCTYKHKCYCSQGSAGALVVQMVWVQLAASQGAIHSLFTYCSLVGCELPVRGIYSPAGRQLNREGLNICSLLLLIYLNTAGRKL